MSSEEEKKIVNKISIVTIIVNIALSIFKFIAGIVACSSAMVSDAIHSASDVITTVIVIIGFSLSKKKADKEHPYGHERFESIAAIILAFILFIVGFGIGNDAIMKIISKEIVKVPTMIAVVAAISSIVIKELMYWYTKIGAKRVNSDALLADAWHHRSDAFSSIGSLIGILGARMGLPILDSIACLIICIFILKVALDIFIDSINKVIDKSCDEKINIRINNIISKNKKIKHIDSIKTRMFGSKIYVDIEISIDKEMKLEHAHEIAHKLKAKLETNVPHLKDCMIHINPYNEQLVIKDE